MVPIFELKLVQYTFSIDSLRNCRKETEKIVSRESFQRYLPYQCVGCYSSSLPLSFSNTEKSSSVVVSPVTDPVAAISLSSLLMILPLRVFGRASLKRISSGLARAPISLTTCCRSSSIQTRIDCPRTGVSLPTGQFWFGGVHMRLWDLFLLT